MSKKVVSLLLCLMALTVCFLPKADAAQLQEYITLTENTQWEDLAGQTLWVDLNGHDLAVGGSGTLYVLLKTM